MPRATKAIDYWKCPWCQELNEFVSVTAEATAVGDLSGLVDEIACPECSKESSVSLSIEFRANPITDR